MTNDEKKAAIAAKEKEGRDAVYNLFGMSYENLVESKNESDVWDMSGRTQSLSEGDYNFFVEIKARDITSNYYDTAFIEYKKLNNLRKIANDHNNAKVYYVCTYTDSLLYVFDLKNISLFDCYIKTVDAPKVSVDNAEDKEPKLFIKLPFNKAKRYKIKNK